MKRVSAERKKVRKNMGKQKDKENRGKPTQVTKRRNLL